MIFINITSKRSNLQFLPLQIEMNNSGILLSSSQTSDNREKAKAWVKEQGKTSVIIMVMILSYIFRHLDWKQLAV